MGFWTKRTIENTGFICSLRAFLYIDVCSAVLYGVTDHRDHVSVFALKETLTGLIKLKESYRATLSGTMAAVVRASSLPRITREEVQRNVIYGMLYNDEFDYTKRDSLQHIDHIPSRGV